MPQLNARRPLRGAATLITVMLLFFIMALVAAYANRNLIVEQRIAATYQQLGVATEGSQQAVGLILSLLNSGRLDANCQSDAAGAVTLRERDLAFDDDGMISLSAAVLATPGSPRYTIACDRVRPSGGWACQCPADIALNYLAADDKPRESMVAAFEPLSVASRTPGTVNLLVHSCADASKTCRTNEDGATALIARKVQLQLLPALKMPPTTAVTATGQVDLGGGMAIVNADAASGGVAVQAGAAVTGSAAQVAGPAGSTVASAVLANVGTLAATTDDRLFRQIFGIDLAQYLGQPALRKLECGGGCAAVLQDLVASGVQMVHHAGDLSLDSDVTVGSATKPVVLVVQGDLSISGPLRIHGLVFVTGNVSWSNAAAGASLIDGALVAGGTVAGASGTAVRFNATSLRALHTRTGSFIRLSGGARRVS